MPNDLAAPQIVLASNSPRRAQLLTTMGIRFEVVPAAIDETALPGESPAALVDRLARSKAHAVVRNVGAVPVLAADTIVVVDGQVLGKPDGREAAIAMLERLSDREHQVITAIALAVGERIESRASKTRVRFRPIDRAEAAAYWETGEPLDKAGGYGIQGIGGIFVAHIEGSYSGVVGLPIAETESLLRAFGVNTWRYRGA